LSVIIFLFVTLLAAALQAAVPTFAATGFAQLPFLLAVVIYYALMHRTARMVQAAILIGVLDDSLGMMPIGFSSFCYASIGLVIAHFREVMTVRAWTTHAFIGAVGNFATTLVTWLLLAKDGQIHWPWHWLVLKLAGSLVTGAILVPVIFAVLSQLDHIMDHGREREAQEL
jgi:rod shape-determining protein MreD